ncbi:MAG: hypothetical protein GF331_15920 [Chitinivibrionales bacterium]|nr:hypothetical protein [Chitinivibrionales bacterium]
MRRILLTALLSGATLFPVLVEAADSPKLDRTSVSVPWHEFRDILDRIRPDTVRDSTIPQLPAEYVIAEAAYTGNRADESLFRFNAAMSVTVLADSPWVPVVLGPTPLLLPGMTVNGRPADVGFDARERCVVVLPGRGDYTVRYAFDVPLVTNAGESSLHFPLPGQTAARVAVTLDDAGYAVKANGVALTPQNSRRGTATTYRGGLGSGQRARITWRREMTDVNVRNAMVLGELNTMYSIGVGMVRIRSQVNVSVFHQGIRRIALQVPDNVEVIDLSGPALAAWETADSGGVRTVEAYLKYRLRDKGSFVFSAEMSYPDSQPRLTLPPITLAGAARQEGTIAVAALANVEIRTGDHSANVLRRDKRELDEWLANQGDALHVYQYLSGAYEVSLDLQHHVNVPVLDALASKATMKSVVRDDGKMVTELTMTVRNRGEQFLRLAWNDHRQLWSLYCNDEPARPAFDSTTSELLVPLEKSTERTAETEVKLVYLSVERGLHALGHQRIEYPTCNVPLQEVSGTLYLPESVLPFGRRGALHDRELVTRTPWFGSLLGSLVQAISAPGLSGFLLDKSYVDMHETSELRQALPAAPQRKSMRTAPITLAPSQAELKRSDYSSGSGYGAVDEVAEKQGELAREEEAPLGYGGAMNEEQLVQQQTILPRITETGLLSIAVNVSYEGRPHDLRASMLAEGESSSFAFFYRRAPEGVRGAVGWLTAALTLLAGTILTLALWSGWTRNRLLLGIVAPVAVALVLNRYIGRPLYLEGIYVPPLLFFSFMAARTLWRRAQEKARRYRDMLASLRDRRWSRQKQAEESPAPQETPVVSSGADDGTGEQTESHGQNDENAKT